jgi:hypothetical protein
MGCCLSKERIIPKHESSPIILPKKLESSAIVYKYSQKKFELDPIICPGYQEW